ncbi:GNAT family N-acetyltransferase [Bacillus sp. CGMCC 1.16607]|uniref:GNAT family N-acetyltransferase n=1 Tax=Bacillus sp. CGMCC 1.16607 TaxID=3351842 RepID=UPI00364315E7
MIQIKRLSECTLEEGVKAWNVGFEGYYFDATTSVENFVNRLVSEGLSPTLSLVAFKDSQPIGIVKNGVRTFNDVKLGWNGGTGVATDYRKQGIGKMLMEATLSILKEEGVTLASLEAIADNQKAIALYENMGYEVVDQLEHLELKGALSKAPFEESFENYSIEKVLPQQIGSLALYKGLNPWQTQWQSAKDSEAVVVKDKDGEVVGYAYYRKSIDSTGKHVGTVLFQCEASQEHPDSLTITHFLLNHVFGSFTDDIRRVIPNLPLKRSQLTHNVLTKIGFTPIAKQVYMLKNL